MHLEGQALMQALHAMHLWLPSSSSVVKAMGPLKRDVAISSCG
jgi:hypothetical protein